MKERSGKNLIVRRRSGGPLLRKDDDSVRRGEGEMGWEGEGACDEPNPKHFPSHKGVSQLNVVKNCPEFIQF